MNVYSIDLKIYATAYIKAETEEEAQAIAAGLKDTGIELPEGYCGDGIEISGRSYQRLEEDIALSPAVTIHGPDEGDTVDFVEEIEEDENVD